MFLFLPAAGYRSGVAYRRNTISDPGAAFWSITPSSDEGANIVKFGPADYAALTNYMRQFGCTVRLASVVSRLARVMFLPAAGMIGGETIRDGGYYFFSSVIAAGIARALVFRGDLFEAVSNTWSQSCVRKCLRLVTVVSELAGEEFSVPACCG